MSNSNEKKHIIIGLVATLLSLSFILFLFLPYFRVYNSSTGQMSYSLTGFNIAIGHSSQGGVIKGSNLLLLGDIIASCGGILTFVSYLIYIFKKRNTAFMFFLLGLSVLCLAVGVAAILLSGPIFQSQNEIKNRMLLYSPTYYLTLVFTSLSFLLNIFIIFYESFSDYKIKKHHDVII